MLTSCNDELFGGAGKDLLQGSTGDDDLTGGSGRDKFLFNFSRDEGNDTNHDFEDGKDLIKFKGGSFADMTLTQDGTSVMVDWANGSIEILNTDVINITDADFLF